MAEGMWTLHDNGSFELQEPYKTQLLEAKLSATQGWTAGLLGYLEPRCPYTAEELKDELLRRNGLQEQSAMETVEEFVLEALSGDLIARVRKGW